MSVERAAPLVIVVSRCAWTLYNFRRSLMREIMARGNRLLAAGAGGDGFDVRLSEEGFAYHDAPISLRGIDPVADVRLFAHFVRLFRRERPQVVHAFTIKPAIYATLAAAIVGVPLRVVTITGLGHAFTTGNPVLRWMVERLYRIALGRAHLVFFQNRDDEALFLNRDLVDPRRCRLVAGSGVDLTRFHPVPLPLETGAPPVFVMVARLLREKGVKEYIEAARVVQARYPAVKFVLVGGPDLRNPSALTAEEIQQLRAQAEVQWVGEVEDVRPHIAAADIVVLPSYREGLPRSLLEAAAMGRAAVATDVPGCREVVSDGVTGLLVPPADSVALATALLKLIEAPGLIEQMGGRARARAAADFDERRVIETTLNCYGDVRRAPVHG